MCLFIVIIYAKLTQSLTLASSIFSESWEKKWVKIQGPTSKTFKVEIKEIDNTPKFSGASFAKLSSRPMSKPEAVDPNKNCHQLNFSILQIKKLSIPKIMTCAFNKQQLTKDVYNGIFTISSVSKFVNFEYRE